MIRATLALVSDAVRLHLAAYGSPKRLPGEPLRAFRARQVDAVLAASRPEPGAKRRTVADDYEWVWGE